jgi:alpha-L-fucosidase
MRPLPLLGWMIAAVALGALSPGWSPAQAPATAGQVVQETKEARDQRMRWWREARFGMFIHWGLYAIPAGEWNGKPVKGIGEWIMNNAPVPREEYEKLVPQFNPVKFNAKQWADTAKAAGMKYIVITSKHHDGFGLWDSKVSDYDVMASSFKRDILKELSQACENEGLVLCFYHSIMDWHHPDAQGPNYPRYNGGPANPNFPRYVETYMKPQLKELLTGYGRIGVLWFDGEWIKDWTEPQAIALYSELRATYPHLIINNRIGKSRKGMQGMSSSKESPGDFGTPEQEIPGTGLPGVDWESCMTMNDTWGYKKNDNNWKSAERIVRMLVDCASKGGNLLLNVGPTAEGLIPQPNVDRLAEVGQWMQVNRESIYGTSASPFPAPKWGRCTVQLGTPTKLYLHVFDWPRDGRLEIPSLRNNATRAYLLADPAKALATARSGGVLSVALPAESPSKHDSVVVVEIDGAPDVAAP